MSHSGVRPCSCVSGWIGVASPMGEAEWRQTFLACDIRAPVVPRSGSKKPSGEGGARGAIRSESLGW